MNFFSKIISVFLFLLVFSFLAVKVQAQEDKNPVNIYFFWANGCPHCAAEEKFLKKLEDKYPQIKIFSYEVTASQENSQLLQAIGKKLSVNSSYVPFTAIGEHYFSGFLNEESTGAQIEEAVVCAIDTGCQDIVGLLVEKDSQSKKNDTLPVINLPVFGQIETKNLSLPLITFFIALLDGFNPCAMWVLLFLISLLLGMQNKTKMWVLGIVFIFTSGLVYFLFLAAWLNLFLFIGFLNWVRFLIGLFALGVGIYQVRDYFINKDGGCVVGNNPNRKKTFGKIKKLVMEKHFLVAVLGIAILAVAVNLVELICSAGLPAIFTQLLSLTPMPEWQYYLYLIFYVMIFMLDDLIIFIIAMVTLKAVGVESKYSRYSHLFGGLIIGVIGILLLFKPGWLMFG